MSTFESDKSWVLVRVQDQFFGLPALHVREMADMPHATPVPCTPDYVLGLITLRGRIVPTIDLRKRLGFPPPEAGQRQIVVVADWEDKQLGLVADKVESIERLDPATSEDLPSALAGSASALCPSVGKRARDGALVLLMRVSALFEGHVGTADLPPDPEAAILPGLEAEGETVGVALDPRASGPGEGVRDHSLQVVRSGGPEEEQDGVLGTGHAQAQRDHAHRHGEPQPVGQPAPGPRPDPSGA